MFRISARTKPKRTINKRSKRAFKHAIDAR